MKLSYYFHIIKNNSIRKILFKVTRLLFNKVKSNLIKVKYTYFSPIESPELALSLRLDVERYSTWLTERKNNANELCTKMYMEHRFDLLGSGWISVDRDSPSDPHKSNSHNSGSLNYPHWFRSRHKKAVNLISENYHPINWYCDQKSGYQWSVNTWCKDCFDVVGKLNGVDIKFPWELARLQHLPQLALNLDILDDDNSKQVSIEIKDQIFDFIATNPPYFGVNWACPMDVAIRASNILISIDIAKAANKYDAFSDEMIEIISKSIYEHGKYIVSNLEWSGANSNNHYLANVAGLLFISSYLDGDVEVYEWLAFSIQEVLSSISTQFLNDGSNFEASTSYHRLSGEMVGYSLALILGLDDEKIQKLENIDVSKWKLKPSLKPLSEQSYSIKTDIHGIRYISLSKEIISKIARIPKFTLDITKPNNEVCQVGDNDSGQFLKLSTNGRILSNFDAESLYINLDGYCEFVSKTYGELTGEYWDENILDHRSLISLYRGILDRELCCTADYHDFESLFSRCLAKGKVFPVENVDTTNAQIRNHSDVADLGLEFGNEYNIKLENFDIETLSIIAYPDFGMFIFKADGFFLSVFAGDIGQNGVGGHCHSDKLSIELFANGRDYLRDPGTYLYTPSLEYRDQFRSIAAHNSPKPEFSFEPSDFLSPFYVRTNFSCRVISYSKQSLSVICTDGHLNFRRDISIVSSKLTITDSSNVALKKELTQFEYYSPGYGKLSRNDLSII